MIRRTFLVGFALLLAATGCWKPEPKLSEERVQRIKRDFPGMTEECVQLLRLEGVDTQADLSTERCFRMEPAKRWTGLWRNEFEDSQFCAAPARACPGEQPGSRQQEYVRLNWPNAPSPGGLYAVEFVGRRSVDSGWYGRKAPNYREMIVDKVISIKELEPPHKPATAEQRKASEERCRKDPQCLTGDEMYALVKK